MAHGAFRYKCEPAATIIVRCGGVRSLARQLGVSPEAVSKCERPHWKGGTDGRMPAAWWRRVMEIGERYNLVPAVVYRRLKSAARRTKIVPPPVKRKKKVSRVHASKAKGDRFERRVAADLTAAGIPAHRVPLSGAVPGYAGDVRADTPGKQWVIQCKITAALAGRAVILRLLAQVKFGRVETDGDDSYLVMRQDVFIRMLLGEPPTAFNVPRIRVKKLKGVADAIAGHDALVFRRDQMREWLAIVREDKS